MNKIKYTPEEFYRLPNIPLMLSIIYEQIIDIKSTPSHEATEEEINETINLWSGQPESHHSLIDRRDTNSLAQILLSKFHITKR